MGTSRTAFSFAPPSATEQARTTAQDQLLRERQAYAKAGGRIFPGQYYHHDDTVRGTPPGSSGTIGVLLPYDETSWRVGPVPVPWGHQVAVYFNFTSLSASFASSGCGGTPGNNGAGFQVGVRMGVKSEYAHPTVDGAWVSGYDARPYAAQVALNTVYGPLSDYSRFSARSVFHNQLMTWNPHPGWDLGPTFESRQVVPFRFWLEYAHVIAGDGIDRPEWGTNCYGPGTFAITDLKLWVHVV